MTTRKQKAAEAPAFPALPNAAWLGFTKQELSATLITSGIFAGPYGKVVMDSRDPKKLKFVAKSAVDQFDAVLEEIHARGRA